MKHNNLFKNKIVEVWNITKNYCNTLYETMKTNKKYNDTNDGLGSTENAEGIEAYEEKLNNDLNNKNIMNIALSGSYGSGKSSILKTFFKKAENVTYYPIFISLGSYDKEGLKKYSDEEHLKMKNEYAQSIERSILQQILYQAKSKELPLSRFNRIDRFSKINLILHSVVFLIGISCFLMLIFPSISSFFCANYNNLIKKVGTLFTVIISLVFVIFSIYIVYKILYYLKYKVKISKLKIKDTEIEINDKNESIFNRFLDEIIYFFQSTKYSVVIIEDLDRFKDIAFMIFEKLKELNQILNASTLINRKITFIYAVKDDFFTNQEDRTKFFESIIPVIPVASYTNAKDYLKKGIKKYEETNSIKINLSDEFIKNISIYLGNMRLIKNALNEFLITKRKLNNKDLDDEKLFSIIVYKNIDPAGYSQLLKQEGFIYETFKQKKENINKIINRLKEEIVLLNKEKNIAEKEILQSVLELKEILISRIYNYSSRYPISFRIDGKIINIPDFLDAQFDLTDLKNKIIEGICNGSTISEADVFKSFGGKDKFITRLQILYETKDKYIEEHQSQIELIEKEIRNIQEMTLCDLMLKYDKETFLPSDFKEDVSSQLVSVLLQRGYIDENYEMYIYNFVEETLKYGDLKFITFVKTNRSLEYSYHLTNLKNVIEELDERDFNFDYVLNFELLEYIIKNEILYKSKLIRIIKNLKELTQEKIQFLNEYTDKYYIGNLYLYLFQNNNDFWKKIYKIKVGDTKFLNKWIKIIFLNYYNIDELSDFSSLKKYVENTKNITLLFSDITSEEQNIIFDKLIKNNFKFEKIEDDNPIWLNFIYNNNLYYLNGYMIQKLLRFKMIDTKNFDKKNYTLIFSNEKLKKMQDYIEISYTEYLNDCYFLCASDSDEEMLIKNMLISEKILDNDKIKLISKENIIYESIVGFSLEICDYIFANSKVKINSHNLEYYFSLNDHNLNENMIVSLNNHYSEIDVQNMLNLDSGLILIREILYNNSLNDEAIDYFVTALNTLDNIEYEIKKISTISLSKMVNKNLIPLNKENYDYIILMEAEIFQTYVKYNIDNIILNCNMYITDEKNLKKVIEIKTLPATAKIKIIDKVNLNLITVQNIEEITEVILNNQQIEIESDKLKLIFNLLNNENKRVQLMNVKLNNSTINSDDIEMIKNISSDYTLNNYSSVNLTKDSIILLEHLKREGIIKNFRKRKNKIVIYN